MKGTENIVILFINSNSVKGSFLIFGKNKLLAYIYIKFYEMTRSLKK